MGAMKRISLISLVLVMLCSVIPVRAQAFVQCGQIVQSEFTENDERHEYYINLEPGDVLGVSAERVGDYLESYIAISAPTTGQVAYTGWQENPSTETGALSERGQYTIHVHSGPNRGVGMYTLYVSCTLRNGTIIGPGDIVLPTEAANVPPQPAPESDFSGFGFPGLPPVDFSEMVKLPLIPDTPMTGVISPANSEILGFTVQGNEGAVLELSYTRVSGNLDLGLAVMSPDNALIFQASLVASETLSTQLTLPTTGEYTIGVFRIKISPPEQREATVFQIRGAFR
jgi:hypothetical protein